jgi:Leucine-rich repeat (LRR) protein
VGVTLEPRGSGRVGSVKLSANALTGSFTLAGDALFPSLGKLVLLDLRANALTGHLPPSVGLLRHLEELYLSLNFLEGPLPEQLGDCSRLKKCGLNGNKFSGPLPPALARCVALHYFDLSCNPNLQVPKGTNLECTSQVKVVNLLQVLGILKRRLP